MIGAPGTVDQAVDMDTEVVAGVVGMDEGETYVVRTIMTHRRQTKMSRRTMQRAIPKGNRTAKGMAQFLNLNLKLKSR